MILGIVLVFLRNRTVSSANCEILISLCPMRIPSISLDCCISLVSPSATNRNRSGDIGHPCATPDFMGIFFKAVRSLVLGVSLGFSHHR